MIIYNLYDMETGEILYAENNEQRAFEIAKQYAKELKKDILIKKFEIPVQENMQPEFKWEIQHGQ